MPNYGIPKPEEGLKHECALRMKTHCQGCAQVFNIECWMAPFTYPDDRMIIYRFRQMEKQLLDTICSTCKRGMQPVQMWPDVAKDEEE